MNAPTSDLAACFDVVDGGVVLRVHAQPGARRSGWSGRHGDAIKIKVAAPAVDGKANAALVTLVADLAGVAPAAVMLTGGSTSRAKRFKITGVTADQMAARLVRALTATVPPP